MIPRNSALPARKEIRFRTFRDGQPNVKIHVVEGGDDSGDGSTTLGKCYVHPLPAETPKGTQVDVRFSYAKDGRLAVSAKLPSLKRKVETVIQRASGLSDQDLAKWRERLDEGIATPDRNDAASSPTFKADTAEESSSDVDDQSSGVTAMPQIVVEGDGKGSASKSAAGATSSEEPGTAPLVTDAPVIQSAPGHSIGESGCRSGTRVFG